MLLTSMDKNASCQPENPPTQVWKLRPGRSGLNLPNSQVRTGNAYTQL